jgi:hypothetical protein
MPPTFGIGQIVRFTPGMHERAYGGLYEIVARLPEERGERQYRVKSTGDKHERIVRESQISPPPKASPAAPPTPPKSKTPPRTQRKKR